jgi:hypothetical protein
VSFVVVLMLMFLRQHRSTPFHVCLIFLQRNRCMQEFQSDEKTFTLIHSHPLIPFVLSFHSFIIFSMTYVMTLRFTFLCLFLMFISLFIGCLLVLLFVVIYVCQIYSTKVKIWIVRKKRRISHDKYDKESDERYRVSIWYRSLRNSTS